MNKKTSELGVGMNFLKTLLPVGTLNDVLHAYSDHYWAYSNVT